VTSANLPDPERYRDTRINGIDNFGLVRNNPACPIIFTLKAQKISCGWGYNRAWYATSGLVMIFMPGVVGLSTKIVNNRIDPGSKIAFKPASTYRLALATSL
jgi:hypothetical protein